MSAKQQLAEAIAALPDSLSIEEIVERLYRAFKLKQSMAREQAFFARSRVHLPTVGGRGTHAGVNLDDNAGVLDLMGEADGSP